MPCKPPDYEHGCDMVTGPVHFELCKSQVFPYNIKVVEILVFTVCTRTSKAHLMGWTATSLCNFRTLNWDSVSPLVKQFNHMIRNLSGGTHSSPFSFIYKSMRPCSLQFVSLLTAVY